MSKLRASAYEILNIVGRTGEVVDISGANIDGALPTSFDYYESVLSPTITAKLVIADIGASVNYDSKYDRQESIGSIFNALPLLGGEKVNIKISSQYQFNVFDFSDNNEPFINKNAIELGKDPTRQSFVLNLTSPYDRDENNKKEYKTRRGKISDTVRSILKDHFDVNCNVDPTQNSESEQGWSRSAFDVILSLAHKSVPVGGDPGYFFYQTQDGFQFRSIDGLISQPPVAKYFYSGILKANLDNDENDFKIIKLSSFKIRDCVDNNRLGVYSSNSQNIDSKTYSFTNKTELLSPNNHLGGQQQETPYMVDAKNSKVLFTTTDIGAFEQEVGGGPNNDPMNWKAKSIMRYNTLLTQSIDIQVPCNFDLRVGDIIECDFEKITKSNKASESVDPVQSGKYLILNLCHHFDPEYSITSLTIVRDTYGKYYA